MHGFHGGGFPGLHDMPGMEMEPQGFDPRMLAPPGHGHFHGPPPHRGYGHPYAPMPYMQPRGAPYMNPHGMPNPGMGYFSHDPSSAPAFLPAADGMPGAGMALGGGPAPQPGPATDPYGYPYDPYAGVASSGGFDVAAPSFAPSSAMHSSYAPGGAPGLGGPSWQHPETAFAALSADSNPWEYTDSSAAMGASAGGSYDPRTQQ